jgi:uncharacterized protein (DUF983 family)
MLAMAVEATDAPTRGRMLWRGCTKRCAVCGQGKLFRRWFRMVERCPRCGLRFERIEGHWTGDLGLNTIVSFGALFLTLIIGFAVTYPDVPGVALFVVAVTVALVVPVGFFPFSKTVWLAIDLIMRPLEDGEASMVTPRATPSGPLEDG